MINDQNIDWIRKRHVWSYWELKGLITPAADFATATVFDEGELLQNPTAGTKTTPNVSLGEIGTLGIVGALFAAAGDILLGEVDLPYDLDPKFPVGFRINWSAVGTPDSAIGVTWILLEKVIKKNVAFTAADVALDTVFGESLLMASNGNHWTSRGIKKALGLSRKDIEDGAALSLSIECDILDSGVTVPKLLALEMDYVPILTVGNGCHTDRGLFTHGRG